MMSDRKRGIIYIGFTIDMPKRGWEHRNRLMDGFTKRHNLIRLMWFECHDSIEKASAMEKKLKNLHRSKKIEIIEVGRLVFEQQWAVAMAGGKNRSAETHREGAEAKQTLMHSLLLMR